MVLDLDATNIRESLVATTLTMPSQNAAAKANSTRHDMSVILVTGSYDHEIRFWEAWSGICSRTIARSGEIGVRSILYLDIRSSAHSTAFHVASKPTCYLTRVRTSMASSPSWSANSIL